MSEQDYNPYAAPDAVSGEAGEIPAVNFALSDEQRKLISSAATLAILAGGLQISGTALSLLSSGLNASLMTASNLLSAGLMGLVPAFMIFAGVSLRRLAKAENDREGLVAGLRSLFIAFAIKGSAMILVVSMGLLMIAAIVLGLGRGLSGLSF